MMSLRDTLAAFEAAFEDRVPAAVAAAIRAANDDLAASGLASRALGVGDPAPDFALSDATGQTVALHRLAMQGPVIVSFFRGGWCPYCSLELRAWQAASEEAHRLGASLVALSPQNWPATLATIERNGLAYPVLSDAGCRVARAFGISFALPAPLRRIYARLGHVLPHLNDSDDWELPIPATYIVGNDRRLHAAIIDPYYQRRAEPSEILDAVRLMPLAAPSQKGAR
jgi:peroxiredoxin